MMAHLQPHLVQWEHAAVFDSRAEDVAATNTQLFPHGPAVSYGWMAQDLGVTGAVGNATDADASRGAEVVSYYGTAVAALLQEVVAANAGALLTHGRRAAGGLMH